MTRQKIPIDKQPFSEAFIRLSSRLYCNNIKTRTCGLPFIIVPGNCRVVSRANYSDYATLLQSSVASQGSQDANHAAPITRRSLRRRAAHLLGTGPSKPTTLKARRDPQPRILVHAFDAKGCATRL